MKKCPHCYSALHSIRHNETELDICRRCGGAFFESGEEKEVLGIPASPESWRGFSFTHLVGQSQLKCPKDAKTLRSYEIQSGEKKVEIDLCEECGGMWVDSGESKRLRTIVLEARQSGDHPSNLSYVFQLISGFPMEVWNPRYRYPYATISLIILFCVVFAIELSYFSSGEYASEKLMEMFSLVSAEIWAGKKIWVLITYAFLHANIYHLAGNVYFLYVFGDNVEDTLGRQRFLLLFFVAVLAGALLQVILHRAPDQPVIGASGGVAGLTAAYLVLFPGVKIYMVLFFYRFRLSVLWYFGVWIAYNMAMAALGKPGTAWLVHIGGFMAGLVIGYVYRSRRDQEFVETSFVSPSL